MNWTTIITAIGFGGIVAASITVFANNIMKRREEFINISKYKMDSVSKSRHHVTKLAWYYSYLSTELQKGLTEDRNKLIVII